MFQQMLEEIVPRLMLIPKRIAHFVTSMYFVCCLLRMGIIGNPYQIENKELLTMTKISEFFLTN